MPEIRVAESLAEADRGQWQALFPGALEDYDYLAAVEAAGLDDFRWRYALAYQGGELVAAAPAFITEYPLETTLTGPGRHLAQGLRKAFPDALTLRLGCLGSPCTETAQFGFKPGLSEPRRAELLTRLIQGFERAARRDRCGLFGAKDVTEADLALWTRAAQPLGYHPMPSLPTAQLDIDFPDMDAYFARLSHATRKDMRRKLRAAAGLRVEVRESIDDVLDQVMALYAETLARADMSFEELTPAYFQGVLAKMPGRAFAVLYFDGDALLGFNLLIQDGETLLDKFFCMEAERGRPLNLYFVSWFTNVRLCLERGLKLYQSGQAAYDVKLKLGSRLIRTSICFRHRNALVNGALQLVAPLFVPDPVLKLAA
ncbi:MAG: GNAT family N-acetyltransferase [Caulobacterales bacterium]|nr:GNAT family N-acetyltransferase [Caulobacterales bacterium]